MKSSKERKYVFQFLPSRSLSIVHSIIDSRPFTTYEKKMKRRPNFYTCSIWSSANQLGIERRFDLEIVYFYSSNKCYFRQYCFLSSIYCLRFFSHFLVPSTILCNLFFYHFIRFLCWFLQQAVQNE